LESGRGGGFKDETAMSAGYLADVNSGLLLLGDENWRKWVTGLVADGVGEKLLEVAKDGGGE
jgi:hypothetical protein